MNCSQCRELLVGYIEGLLDDNLNQAVKSHLDICAECRKELEQVSSLQKRLVANGASHGQNDLENAVMDRIVREQALKLRKANQDKHQVNIWRFIMRSPITRLTAAAVILVAIVVSAALWNRTIPTVIPTASASAVQVLTDAAKAVEDVQSIHIKARMRTLPHDNMGMIGLKYDFVPIEMWKKINDAGFVLWRIEKPGRVVVTDGNSTTMLIRPNHVVKGEKPYPIGSFDSWYGHLMNVDKIIDNALKNTMNQSGDQLCMRNEVLKEGTELVIEIESAAQGDYTNDWCKNKFITDSDHKKVYRFDAETKLLKGFEVFVHTDKKDVLVFEVNDIEYNPQIDDALFTLELPKDVIWLQDPKVLPDNEKYVNMTPKQAAEAFFKACSEKNWDEVLKFWSMSAIDEELKGYLGGLEVVSLGEPFKSGRYPGWFIPYEIKFKNGDTKKWNLAVRNDNPAKRFVVDGGI
jgi:outer membrane lipoprotein-sorting protein